MMDIDVPDIKRANWNCSHDVAFTSDVLYAKPVFTDHLLANTRCKMDINNASFANPTVSPLYGRYRVKYLAFFSPYRLYMRSWRNDNQFSVRNLDKGYNYPILTIPSVLNNGSKYVPPTSLGDYLGVYPPYFQTDDWSSTDKPEPSTAFSFLAFWDIYRHYIANVQEPNAYCRTQSFIPSYSNGSEIVPSVSPVDTTIPRTQLDAFFTSVLAHDDISGPLDVSSTWSRIFNFDPIFCDKNVASREVVVDGESVIQRSVNHNFHYGLPIAPFSADPFTSWLNNDNIELERTTSSMIVDNGAITMDQWRVANAIQKKFRKYLFNLGDFQDMIDSQYGVKPSTSISKPMFLGAFTSDIVFNDVVSTAQTGDSGDVESNTNLGSRAGYGRGTDRNKSSFIDFTAQEPGVLQVIQIIIPEVFYFEGRDLQYLTKRYDEEFNPEYNIGLLQDLHVQQLNLTPGLRYSAIGADNAGQLRFSTYNESIGKQPYGMQHICKTNRAHGMFTMPEAYKGWLLIHSYNRQPESGGSSLSARGYYSSYGYPEEFNQVFANNQTIDNFQFYLSFDYTKYNVVLKKFIPFI